MEEIFKRLLKSQLLSEETAEELRREFVAIQEKAKEDARVELKAQYDADIDRLAKALEMMVEDTIGGEVRQLKERIERAVRAEKRAKRAIATADDRASAKYQKKIELVKDVVTEEVTKKLAEIESERVAERRATAAAVREARTNAANDRENLIRRGGAVLEAVVEKALVSKIAELHEDIVAARRDAFGREIFEAFYSTFQRTHWDTDVEYTKLKTRTKKAEAKAARLEAVVEQAKGAIKKAKRDIVEGERRQLRESKINQLTSRLNGNLREDVKTILSEVPTEKLGETFRKYVSAVGRAGPAETSRKPVLAEGVRRRRRLDEATLRTGSYAGDKRPVQNQDDENLRKELDQLREYAGIGK